MKILTIVIPSYNTEKFINKNIETYLDERLYGKAEILIINDGSKDRTSEIAHKYEEKYPGYIRLIDKENGGHGSVINKGIGEAQGKYLKVIDADDWVDTANLVLLVNDLSNSNADVVLNPYICIDEKTRKETLCGYNCGIMLGRIIPFSEVIDKNIKLRLHSTTYKTEILRDNPIHLTEKCFYEDFEYNLFPVPYLKTAMLLDYPVYWYLVGQTTQSVSTRNVLKNVDMYIKVYKDSVRYFDAIKFQSDESYKTYMEDSICIFLRSFYNIFLRNYKVKKIVQEMLLKDAEIKKVSCEFYDLVAKKNKYINVMRGGNKIFFYMIAKIFTIYKS